MYGRFPRHDPGPDSGGVQQHVWLRPGLVHVAEGGCYLGLGPSVGVDAEHGQVGTELGNNLRGKLCGRLAVTHRNTPVALAQMRTPFRLGGDQDKRAWLPELSEQVQVDQSVGVFSGSLNELVGSRAPSRGPGPGQQWLH